MNSYEFIKYQKKGHVATMTFNRPERLNAMDPDMEREMRAAFDDTQYDPRIRVLILTGEGEAFSTGEDVRVLDAWSHWKPEAGSSGQIVVPMPTASAPMPRYMVERVKKPVIAAVNGVAAGAGYGLAMASDIRIGTPAARFAHIYLRRALVPSAETWWLPRLIGLGPALYHILMSDSMDAEEALRLGLLIKIVPPENLLSEATAIANKIAEGPPMATMFAKMAAYNAMNMTFEDAMEYVGTIRQAIIPVGEFAEGTRSFLEKRKPVFDAGGTVEE
jgi:enoyl-CoA hydratase/carnithine racemase